MWATCPTWPSSEAEVVVEEEEPREEKQIKKEKPREEQLKEEQLKGADRPRKLKFHFNLSFNV